jgi:hypothetical protein
VKIPVDVVPVEPKRRRTRAEIANDRIIAEQMKIAEGAKRAEQMRLAAKAEWERGRPREFGGFDHSRYQR